MQLYIDPKTAFLINFFTEDNCFNDFCSTLSNLNMNQP